MRNTKPDMKHVAMRMDLETKWTIEFLGQKRPYHNTSLSEFIRDAIADKIKKEIYGDLRDHKVDWIPEINDYIRDKWAELEQQGGQKTDGTN